MLNRATRTGKALTALFLSAILTVSGVPVPAASAATADAAPTVADEDSSSDETTWKDRIDELLAADDYVEGEVIIAVAPEIDPHLVTSSNALADADVTETMATDGDVFEKATGSTLPQTALEGAQEDGETVSSSDVEVKSYLVSKHDMSTEQILNELTDDQRVLDASPNYRYSPHEDELPGAGDDTAADDATENESGNGDEEALAEDEMVDRSANTSNDAGISTQAISSFTPDATTDATTSDDGTSLQWALNKNAAYKGSFDAANVAMDDSWNTGVQNAQGVVAVFDTGVDYTHPDLAASMVDMSAYQAQVGGTSHGFNAINTSAEPLDDNGHGTHVAGIIAASTNGYGVSGVANGVKLLPVKVGNANGSFTSANIQRGYDYLKRVAQAGVDLRVINNSWSGKFKDPALSLAVCDLGDLGVLSVFASGNDSTDIDGKNFTAASFDYAGSSLVVNSLNMDGTVSVFSNRGRDCTDLFAPGSSIISTTRSDTAGTYIPSVMRDTTSTYITFNDDNTIATNEKGKSLGSIDTAHGFDAEGGCLEITGKELGTARSTAADSNAKKRVILDVPVDESSLSQAGAVGCSVNFTGKTATKGWLEVLDSTGHWLSSTAEQTVVDTGNWSTLSLDVAKACKAHARQVALYRDGAGQAYIKVAVCLAVGSLKTATSDLKIDCVGVGSTTWHYAFMSGTSMAAPLVSGLAAVLSNQIPNFTSLNLSARTNKLHHVILAAVYRSAALTDLCVSNGSATARNFARAIADDADTAYIGTLRFTDAPNGGYTLLTIRGIGFGDQTGYLGMGIAAMGYEIISWTDDTIVARTARIQGGTNTDTTVTNGSGSTSNTGSTSALGGENESDDPSGSGGSGETGGSGESGGSGKQDGSGGSGDPATPDGSGNPSSPSGTSGSNRPAVDGAAAKTSARAHDKACARILPGTGDVSTRALPMALAGGAVGLALVGGGAIALHRERRRRRG